MGQRVASAKEAEEVYARSLVDLKDSVTIVLLNRLGGTISIPMCEIDETGKYLVELSIIDEIFHFQVREK